MATKEGKELPKGLLLRGGVYHLRFMFKGQLVAESTHCKNLRDAERVLNKKRAELHTDMVLDNKRSSSFYDALDKFVSTRSSPNSKKSASRMAYLMKKSIEDKNIKKVELHEIQDAIATWYDDYALHTITLYVKYWNAFTVWCKDQKYHICGKVKNIKPGVGRTRWLTTAEQSALLTALDPKTIYPGKCEVTDRRKQDNYDFVMLILDTGLRYSEAANLSWNNIDFERQVLYIHRIKGGAPTTLSMTSRVREMLIRRKAMNNDLVFKSKINNRAGSWMSTAIKRAKLDTSGGKVTIHTLRHTFASTMIQNGLDITEVQYLLGHQNIQMTMRYAHLRKKDVSTKAADVMNRIANNYLGDAIEVSSTAISQSNEQLTQLPHILHQ